jgi:hypothetical protein
MSSLLSSQTVTLMSVCCLNPFQTLGSGWDGHHVREGALGLLIVTHDTLSELTRVLSFNTRRVAHSFIDSCCSKS